MNVYIGDGFQDYELLRYFLKDNIPIDKDASLKMNRILISRIYNEIKRDIVCDWEEFVQSFIEYAYSEWKNNYEMYYLKNAIYDAQNPKCRTVIAGSSYARYGIEEKYLRFYAKNVSLASQDFYYASRIIKEIVSENPNISKVVIGCNYYYFFSDLSMEKNEIEHSHVSKTYYPLFEDAHNAMLVTETMSLKRSDIWDIWKMIEFFMRQFYLNEEGAFNYDETICLWEDKSKLWEEISDKQKEQAALIRTQSHNKAIRYQDTYIENQAILDELLKYCANHDVSVYICVLPATKQYMRYLNKDYKTLFYEALNQLDGIIHVVDFNEWDVFDDRDFRDMDHLNSRGAVKVTKILNNIL